MGKTKLDFNHLDPKTRSKIVKGSVIPRPIAWITTLNQTLSINLAPFSYFTVISPTLLAVSFQKTDNNRKDTFINLMREKEAVVHIVDESLLEIMDKTSAPLKINESEFSKTGLSLSPSLKIKTPGISEALIRFEVILDKSIPLMNYELNKEEGDLVILRVVTAVLDDKVYNRSNNYILTNKLQPVARSAGAEYTGLRTLSFKRKY